MKIQEVEAGWAVVDTEMNRIFAFGGTRSETWRGAFAAVAKVIGGEFSSKYWKRIEPSIRAAAKYGFKLVRATRTVEVKVP